VNGGVTGHIRAPHFMPRPGPMPAAMNYGSWSCLGMFGALLLWIGEGGRG
jgi:hypothetical protein